MIGGDTSTPPIWRTVLTEFGLHATSASGAPRSGRRAEPRLRATWSGLERRAAECS